MNITFNGNVYNVERISRLSIEGVRIKIDSPDDLLELDTAPTHNVNSLVVASVGDKYRVLIRPTQEAIDAAPSSGIIYLMSKMILKKCLFDAKYETVPIHAPPPPREERDYRPRNGNHRPMSNDRPRHSNNR